MNAISRAATEIKRLKATLSLARAELVRRPAFPRAKAAAMDDLLKEFLIETNESLDVVDVELVRFEQEPNNAEILGNVFRLVHTIKGTCGFLGLPRLEALAHAAETLMSKFRDGMPVTGDGRHAGAVHHRPDQGHPRRARNASARAGRRRHRPDPSARADGRRTCASTGAAPAPTDGTLVPQTLERPLRPGEVSLDELERVFRDTPGPASGRRRRQAREPRADKNPTAPRRTTTPRPRSPASRSASASIRSKT